ncbi:hypothetical protein LZ30DRAFT_721260 [Colletotrichum cereale]|nr:hypothetical protein LZ30DRAFT_721260 [Colletotrichum cereale]
MGERTQQKMATHLKTRVELVLWDARSDEHIRRMHALRVACGWRADEVGEWKYRQLKGTKFMWWVVLVSDAYTDGLSDSHLVRYPDERTPLEDTANAEIMEHRPLAAKEFVPVGHISLEKKPEMDTELKLPANGMFWVTSLYISWALQEGGIGRLAMRQLENLAAEKFFEAGVMALDTPPKEFQLSPEFIKTSYTDGGWGVPKVRCHVKYLWSVNYFNSLSTFHEYLGIAEHSGVVRTTRVCRIPPR